MPRAHIHLLSVALAAGLLSAAIGATRADDDSAGVVSISAPFQASYTDLQPVPEGDASTPPQAGCGSTASQFAPQPGCSTAP